LAAGVRKILYLSHAPEEVYGIIRAEVPNGYELLTLERDDHAERLAKIRDADVVIVAATPLARPLIEAADRLRLVHHQGVGYQDTIDLEALKEHGAALALTPQGTTVSVAEHTIMLMLAVLRRLSFADSELRRGRFHINALRPVSRNLQGRLIGYVGMGRIGQAVAARARAFEALGLYHDPADPLSEAEAAALGLRRAGLSEVVAKAEVLTLHVPATPATRHLIDAAAIARMRLGAVVINTARGPLIDERALYEALRSGRLGGAGLDVFDPEPPSADNPLLQLPNVVVTPHIAGGTRDTFSEKMRAIFANVVRFDRGEALENRVEL
jgi:phosphoglycerate dehydrogenase-like enzyme